MEEKIILILHGWGSCAKNWAKVKDLLDNKGYKVYVPDLPGFGDSPELKKPWSIDDYADWVGDYCEKHGLSHVFLLGHSFGGSIAVRFSLKYPEKITKLFLAAPALIRKKSLKKEIIKRLAQPFSFLPQGAKKLIYIKALKSDYPLEEGALRDTFLRIIKEDQLAELSNVSPPTVLIWGEKDTVTPLEYGYLIKERIKNSKLIVLENQGHDLNRKIPELLAEKILDNIK